MKIRPFQERDAKAVTALLHDLWSHDRSMLALYQVHRDGGQESHRLHRTLVATVEEQVIGVGTLFENLIHPSHLSLVINVARSWQRQGIGSALYHALEERSDGRPWKVKAIRRDSASMGFLARYGFRAIMTTFQGLLLLDDYQVRSWIQTLPSAVSGYRITAFDESTSDVSREEVALLRAAVYRRYHHSWSPAAPFSTEQAGTVWL